MRYSLFMFLVIGAGLILFGCTKDNYVIPDLNQDNQEELINKKATEKVDFVGVSYKPGPSDADEPVEGENLKMNFVVNWYDYASEEPLITGHSKWIANMINHPVSGFRFWGKSEIYVGVPFNGDIDTRLGLWEVSWHGEVLVPGTVWNDMELPNGGNIAYARGTGKEGNVKGMVASWEYVLTNWPDPAPDGSYFYYKFKGTLLKK